MAFLGIDLGTSGLRALLVDDDGKPIGSVEHSYQTKCQKPGWSEQNPKDWITALESAVFELKETFPNFLDVKGIGVSGHMHGATLVNSDARPIRSCILWNDTRSHVEAAKLDELPEVRALSGNIVFPGFTAPKLEWVRQNEPANHGEISKVLLPAGYLNYYLTGDFVADRSDSAGTSWLNIQTRNWSNRLLESSHMRRDQMPRLVEGSEPAGRLRSELADRWGLSKTVIVAGGAGDNAAAACGIGVLDEGQGFISLGTSGVLLVARDSCEPAPNSALHTFCHAIPNKWYQMGVMLSATDSLNWLSRISGQTPAQLTAALGSEIFAPGPVQFLPYLSGERTPHNDAQIRGAFTGLGTQTTLADLTRAVLEGVAFGLRDSAEVMNKTGTQLREVYVIGGGAASRYWVKLIATVLNIKISIPKGSELGAALGAARLAIVAATGASPKDVMLRPQTKEEIFPDLSISAAFDESYQRFKAAYPAIKLVQSCGKPQ